MIDEQLHVDIEDADFVLVFHLKTDGRVRLVGSVREPPDHRELSFEDVKGKAIEHLKLDIAQVNWFSTYHVHHRVAACFQEGRFVPPR